MGKSLSTGIQPPRTDFTIRQMGIPDWEQYKAIRLQSLQDAPDAFGATYDNEVQITDAHWQSRLRSHVEDRLVSSFIAEMNGEAIGLAGGVIFNDTPGTVNIFQMWVSPTARRRGVAMALLRQIQLWAGKNACSKMALSVNANNEDALTLYKKAGFWAEGKLDVLRPGSTIPIQPMIKKI